MEIFYTSDIVPYDRTVIALGEFDALHTAHMTLIHNGIEFAKKNNMKFGVMCFSDKLCNKGTRLLENKERARLLYECDFIYEQNFNDDFKNLSPEEFGVFLKNFLHVDSVFAGFNYHFGKNAAGNADTLRELNLFNVYIQPECKAEGKTISSTRIREMIVSGDISGASKLLARPYRISGIVSHGMKNGEKLGFPTLNIDYNPQMILPKKGVYIGYTSIYGMRYESVINVGNNPTFGAKKITIESYLFDFEGDAYGETADVDFLEYLRDDIRFDSMEELKRQICIDVEVSKEFFKKAGLR